MVNNGLRQNQTFENVLKDTSEPTPKQNNKQNPPVKMVTRQCSAHLPLYVSP